PWNAVLGMSRYLEQKLTVPAFMQQRSFGRPFHRKPAQHERPRCEAEILVRGLAPGANQFNDFHAFSGLSRNGKPEIRFLQNLPRTLKARLTRMVLISRYALRQRPPRRLQAAAGSRQSGRRKGQGNRCTPITPLLRENRMEPCNSLKNNGRISTP